MASQWYCRVLDQEFGPLTFADLAAMLRTGTLSEDDPVRRNGEHQWTAARNVVGLLHQARVAAPAAGAESIPTTAGRRHETANPPSEAAAGASNDKRERNVDEGTADQVGLGTAHSESIPSIGTPTSRRKPPGWLWGLAVALMAVVVIVFAVPRPEVFPEPQGTAEAADGGFQVPLLGGVSLVEYVLLWLDALLLAAAILWLLRRWILQRSR